MAKAPKSTKTSETPTTAATPAVPTAITEKGGKDMFRAVSVDGKWVDPAKKVAPQAQVIINTIRAAGAEGVNRGQLVANLKGVLTTKQPEGRILSYYQKSLIESGAITLEKVNAPASAPVPAE